MIVAIPSLIQMIKERSAMFRQFRAFPRIHGKVVPGRRFTASAAFYFGAFVALSLLVVGLLLDFIGWLITVQFLGASCYGVMCLLG
jgi:hypothetical protein